MAFILVQRRETKRRGMSMKAQEIMVARVGAYFLPT